jgi:N-acetylglucosaminyl-diphospho-decaprenol L-rhamnosyltransferase
METDKKISIIITTYNSSKVILSCLEKINFDKYAVYVVDNISKDNTIDLVTKNFPKAIIIKNNHNIGYGRANNVALNQTKTEFALILNPDAFILENDLEKLLETIENDEKIAIIAPLLLTKFPITEDEISIQNAVVNGNLIQDFKNYKSVSYIIGACMLLRMSIFKQIGFYNEKIFLYYEDDEICYRAIKNGYICAIKNDCFAFHIGQKSSGNNLRDLYRRYWHRSLSKFYWKEARKNIFSAYKSALKLIVGYFLRSILYLITFKFKKFIESIASMNGGIAYLFRLSAFDKNDNPRG